MLNPAQIAGAKLLPLPQGSSARPLPFLTGSLLPARILQNDHGGTTLLLGSIRMQVSLPTRLPGGQLWVLIVENGTPPKLRIMSESQATTVLAERLAGQLADAAGGKPPQLQQQDWPLRQQGQQHGFSFHPASHGDMLFIDDEQSGEPKGRIERESAADGFTLHGRLDLDAIGAVYFAIEQHGEAPISLQLRVAGRDSYRELQQPFAEWLAARAADDGAKLAAQLSEGCEPIVAPAHASGHLA
jgi:hypothetical protein